MQQNVILLCLISEKTKTQNKEDNPNMKKINKLVGAACALVMSTSVFALTACGGDQAAEEKTVMNVSLNPKVEFVLDADDKVISVNALNEEGNLIISAEAFENVEGMDADKAVELFASVSKENGFLFEGRIGTGDNKIEVSFSGDAEKAAEIYEEVKATVEAFCSEENITATIEQIKAITKAELEALVAECAPYLEAAEIKAMEYAELLDQLIESRMETAEFYSQELKKAYYEAKAFAYEKAELEALKGQLNVIGQAAVDAVGGIYEGIVENIEKVRFDNLVAEDGIYQVALAQFRAAKAQYLNFKNYVLSLPEDEVTVAITEQLASLEAVLEQAEEALISAGEQAHALLDSAKAGLKEAYDSIIETIEGFSVKAEEHLDDISAAQKQALDKFTGEFEAKHGEVKEKMDKAWGDMRENLKKGYEKPEGEEPQQ